MTQLGEELLRSVRVAIGTAKTSETLLCHLRDRRPVQRDGDDNANMPSLMRMEELQQHYQDSARSLQIGIRATHCVEQPSRSQSLGKVRYIQSQTDYICQ